MIVPPLWQTPYKGRITAMTFGTIFAMQELYFFYFLFIISGTVFATPLYRLLHTPHPGVW